MNITDPTTFRSNIRQKLEAIIDDEKIAINLEKGVFNFAIKEASSRKIVKKWENKQFIQLYMDRMRTIYINMKNEVLLNQLKSKEITPQAFAFMTHQEINPEHWKDYIDKKKKRDMSKYTNNVEASTDMFVCKKCKSRRCTYYELQVRSADEPTNVFITCLDCGKNWKQ
jgi:DNA-directed RNA polymerase subunit M/transcription elongation factor TFIIS